MLPADKQPDDTDNPRRTEMTRWTDENSAHEARRPSGRDPSDWFSSAAGVRKSSSWPEPACESQGDSA